MAGPIVDGVLEELDTEGGGTITLGGAVQGYSEFQERLDSGDRVFYALSESTVDGDSVTDVAREIGLGTYVDDAGVHKLQRDVVLSTEGGATVDQRLDLGDGTKRVAAVAPSAVLSPRVVVVTDLAYQCELEDHGTVLVADVAGDLVVTLPPPLERFPGWDVAVKLAGTGTARLAPRSMAERIDGEAAHDITARYAFLRCVWTGMAWSISAATPVADQVIASDVALQPDAVRVVRESPVPLDALRWLDVTVGRDGAYEGTYRVRRRDVKPVAPAGPHTRLFGFAGTRSEQDVQLVELDPADGGVTLVGAAASLPSAIDSLFTWSGDLAWTGTELLAVYLTGADKVRLYHVDMADGTHTARGSEQAIEVQAGHAAGGIGLAWTGAELLMWVVTDDTDASILYAVSTADGTVAKRGSARALGSGSWYSAGLAWTGADLLSYAVNFDNRQGQLRAVNPMTGALTARGPVRSLAQAVTGAKPIHGLGLAWVNGTLALWLLDESSNARLIRLDTANGTPTPLGASMLLSDIQGWPTGANWEAVGLTGVGTPPTTGLPLRCCARPEDAVLISREGANSIALSLEGQTPTTVIEVTGIP